MQSVGRLARGNPLHATELALAIPAHDGRPASDWLLGIADQARTAAESFEASAATRLAALSRSARSVTAALAVAARPLDEHQIFAVTQLAPAELASAVFELEGGRFLRREAGSFSFAHDSYGTVARGSLEDEEQGRIHARLAAVLAESAARNPAARIEVALHLERAGIPGEARAHAVAAAEFAGSVGAVSERAESLELVRRVSGQYDGAVAAALAECYLGLREFDRLDALCDEARGQAELPEDLKGEFRYLEIAADHHSGRAPLSGICDALERLVGGPRAGRLHAPQRCHDAADAHGRQDRGLRRGAGDGSGAAPGRRVLSDSRAFGSRPVRERLRLREVLLAAARAAAARAGTRQGGAGAELGAGARVPRWHRGCPQSNSGGIAESIEQIGCGSPWREGRSIPKPRRPVS